MPSLTVDGLDFAFPEGWRASRYDDWSFYRRRFARMRDGIKALDLLALSPTRTAWLIEVKDYRQHARTKSIELADEVGRKVFDTLAALLPASLGADDAAEKRMAKALLGGRELRIVLHLEQPAKHSRLRPRAINPPDVRQQLRRVLKPIDAHPLVVERGDMGTLEWTVS